MTWSVSWSWQAPSSDAIESVNGHLCVAYGLELVLFDESNKIQWERSMPFKVHAICNADGRIGVLAAHAFYLLNTVDGSMVHEGRSCPGASCNFSTALAEAGSYLDEMAICTCLMQTVLAYDACTLVLFDGSSDG